MKQLRYVLAAAAAAVCAVSVAAADPKKELAFPGAEGFGAYARGGRGGKTLHVTTLADYLPGKEKPIAGSLRAAVDADGPRIVEFKVAGLIELKAPLRLKKPYLTLTGHNAPGDGICIKGRECVISTHDVIIRYLRFRTGDLAKKEDDSLSVYKAQNVMIDHCSASWSVDETLSVTGEGCTNVTVQWCLITESLNNSVHSKGEHGYGSLLRTDGDITFHHNLYAHHKSRCPRPGTYGKERGILLDFRNNVIYNWGTTAGYTAADRATLNYIGNYLKPGPSTRTPKSAFKIGGATTKMFVAGNFLAGADQKERDDWHIILKAADEHKAAKEFPVAAVKTETAEQAYKSVLEQAGALLPVRDSVDARVINEVKTGKGRIIDSQRDVGGWPVYAEKK
jgi:pectate lyase